jgi:hypothetical protein
MREFEVAGEFGELGGDFAGDAGADAGGVERKGVEPDGAEAVLDFGAGEIGEEYAVVVTVRELGVIFSRQGEIGVEFNTVADVDNDEERRPTFVERNCFGVGLGLIAGGEHGFVPAGCGADGCAAAGTDGHGGGGLVAALFGFEHETAALVEVDASGAGGAVAVVELDGAFEDVGVEGVVWDGGVGTGKGEEVAEFGEEELVVGAFSGAGLLPALDEGFV